MEFSHRPGRDLINMAKARTNVIPIVEVREISRPGWRTFSPHAPNSFAPLGALPAPGVRVDVGSRPSLALPSSSHPDRCSSEPHATLLTFPPVSCVQDARHPLKYRMLVGMVDTIFADVAQPDQVSRPYIHWQSPMSTELISLETLPYSLADLR